jgi:hypothetical protein
MTSFLRTVLGHLIFARNLDDLNMMMRRLADEWESFGLTHDEYEIAASVYGECLYAYQQTARKRRERLNQQDGPDL